MDIISMVLFTIVIVAQIVLFTLHFMEKNHSKRRYLALLQYIDRSVEDADCEEAVMESVREMMEASRKKNDEQYFGMLSELRAFENRVSEKISNLAVDYTEAQQAANKVNDFASSLSSIFDYDPMEAIRRNRNKEAC